MEYSNYLVCEHIEQNNYAGKIFSGSVNTIRLLTMVDKCTGEPFIAGAVHRFGTNKTAPVDNWIRGGIVCFIEPDNGVLGKGVTPPINGNANWHDHHPETGEKIVGKKIEGWETLVVDIMNLCKKLDHTPYIGWDIAVTDDGFCVIEANNMPDLILMQIHKPLLKDSRVVKFYQQHGVLKKRK